MTEEELQGLMEDTLDLQGWLWFHDRSLAYAKVKANRAGFPDLCAVHPVTGATVFLELKSEKGKLTKDQEQWGEALLKSPAIYAVIRPADADRAIRRLGQLADPLITRFGPVSDEPGAPAES